MRFSSVKQGTGIYAMYADLLDTRSRINMMRLRNTGCDTGTVI
jgi:hypothetical protein